jgi:polygalacturonase
MLQILNILALVLSSKILVSAIPTPTVGPGPKDSAGHVERAGSTCTFTGAAQASASKTACTTIVLDNIAVPAGVTLDLTKLASGTHVSSCLPRSRIQV